MSCGIMIYSANITLAVLVRSATANGKRDNNKGYM